MKYYLLFIYYIFKSLTFKKIWNYCMLRFTFYISIFLKKHVTTYPPAFVSIEPTNICNLQCPECPTGNKTSTVSKGYISPQTFTSIVEACKPYTIAVNLYFQGEPFLHTQLVHMITQLHKARIITSISTNAHFIDSKNAEAIVRSGLTHLIVSFDGYNQETYEIYRKQGSFEKVTQALTALQQAKQTLQSHTPIIELQCLLFKHTQHHTQTISKLGKKYGADKVVFKTAQLYSAEHIDLLPDKQYSRYTIKDNTIHIKQPLKNACWRMWSTCVISWQGTILPCCFDKNHTFAYGSLTDKSFLEIITSEQTHRFKKTVHTKRSSIKMCNNCSTP
jgi:radical SAM protein with 4Fe4S-binding SPASM domain